MELKHNDLKSKIDLQVNFGDSLLVSNLDLWLDEKEAEFS